MTVEQMAELLTTAEDDEFLKFSRNPPGVTKRPDLYAFLLLDKLVPGVSDMVSAAEHDEFFLAVVPEELAAVISPEEIIQLVRCGVRWSGEFDCLCMFA